jgi:ribosomal protein S18 acetylase RimI-like enzyme
VTELRLEVYAGNAAAIRAYEKAGFSQLIAEMRMSLPDDDR